MLNAFKKQPTALKLALTSDFIECIVIAFCSPIVFKMVYASEQVTAQMLAFESMMICIATIVWNCVYTEARRYKLFRKTYLFGLIGYSFVMATGTLLCAWLRSPVSYFWLSLIAGITIARIWTQGNTELFGNIFSTEQRKTYDRLNSSLASAGAVIGSGFAMFMAFNCKWIAFVIWGLSYIMDAVSMTNVYMWAKRNDLLKPRKESKYLPC